MTKVDEITTGQGEEKPPTSLFDIADVIGLIFVIGGASIAILTFIMDNPVVAGIAAGAVVFGFGLMLTAEIGRALLRIAETNAAILDRLDDDWDD